MNQADAIEKLRSAAQAALNHHGVMLPTDPPLDAWKHHRVSERLREGLDALAAFVLDAPQPDLTPVINWLEGGCDPKRAADELRLIQQRLDGAPQ